MRMIGSLLRTLGYRFAGGRRSTPSDIREMIDLGQLDAAAAAVELLAEGTPDRTIAALCLRGEIAYRQRRDDEAQGLFQEALKLAPGYGDAHYGLSLILHAQGDKETALQHAQFAANRSNAARVSAQLGLCQLELGNVSQADTALSRATRMNPRDKWSWNNLGIVLRTRGNIPGAQDAFRRALEIDPAFAQALGNLDLLTAELRHHRSETAPPSAPAPVDSLPPGAPRLPEPRSLTAGIEACEARCAEHPDDGACAIELSCAYRERGDTQSGIDVLQAFHARFPEDLDVLSELGRTLVREHEFKLAKPLIEMALERRKDNADLLAAMADIRTEQQRHGEAGELLDHACQLESRIDLKAKLASNLIMRCRFADSLAVMDEILKEAPTAAEDLAGLQVYAMTHLGQHDEALPILDRAIALNPHEPNRRFPRATIHLLNERFDVGWDDYAYRNLSSTKHLRMPPYPQWRGEPLAGKTLLVLADQGLGDQVMFASCLPDVLALKAARTVVEVNGRAAKTIARSFPDCEVIATQQDNALEWIRDIGTVDYFITIGDLPQQFRRSLEAFPDHTGYLVPDPERVAHWRSTLAALGPRPKIGVSWRGGTEHTRKVLRSLDVGALRPLFDAVDADWVCLQYGDVAADLAAARAANLPMSYWAPAVKDLDEFAALIGALDLVVTVCNTTVHYAGAVGKDVWVMAPRIPEWRYGLRSTRLPWYPSSRIYRQGEGDEWAPLLARVAADMTLRYPRT